MFRYLQLAGQFWKLSIQDDAAYRSHFFMHILQALFQLLGELIGLWTIFSNTQEVAGWTVWELLALLGVFRVMGGMIGLIIQPNMRQIMEQVRDGTLDYIILKPVNTQFYMSASRIVIWRGVDVLVGLAVATFASVKLSTQVSVPQVINFLILLAAGMVIIYSIWLALGTLAFWFTRINNIEMVFWNVFEAGRYPVDIYRPWPAMRLGLTYVIPLAFLTTFPASALIGRHHNVNPLFGVLVAGVSLFAATSFFHCGLRRYSSASS